MRILPTFGVFFVLASALVDAQDAKKEKPAPPPPKPNYYPLEVGNTWHYRATKDKKTSTIITGIAKIDDVNGEKLARLETPNVNRSEHLSQTDKGVFRHRMSGLEVTPPFKLLPYPAKVGAKWDGEFTVEKGKGKHKYAGEIQKEETIEVPAGKYKALRVLILFEDNSTKVEATYWFAQDVGFVKQLVEPAPSTLLELERFERKK